MKSNIVFSQNNFLSGLNTEGMVKIKNKKRLMWCLKQYKAGKANQKDLARLLSITPRRFRQVYSKYKSTGIIHSIGQSLGRPKEPINPKYKELIMETHRKYCLNAVYLENVIFAENNISIHL